ncbi:MAG: AfsR/SARP family transcriptional regulator [Actinomycetota bacterium]|nr:AfsR/SARP family transcriptional regulator [Actinomycetota bacterium]
MGETVDGPALRVIGPLELWHDGVALPLPSARPQTLLVLLALRLGQWRETDELIETLWDGRPPRSASGNLRTYVCQWRKVLKPLSSRMSLESTRGAYRLNVGRRDLDIGVFEDRLAQGQWALASREADTAVSHFGAVLRLWRGDPFGSLGTYAMVERARLIELRDKARCGLADALMAQKRPADAITVLREAVRVQPFDEQVWARLVAALADSGRRADAVVTYQEIRQLLWDELGMKPGRALVEVHQRLFGPVPDAGAVGCSCQSAVREREAGLMA